MRSLRRTGTCFVLFAVFASSAAAQNAEIAQNHYRLGLSYEAGGLPSRALQEYNEARRQDPSLLAAHERAAYLLFREGRYADAASALEAAVKLAPDRADLWSMLGSTYNALGRAEDTIRAYETSLARNADQPELRLRLARSYLKDQRLDEARAVLEHPALANDIRALVLRAYAHGARGEIADAATLYRRAVEIDPNQGAAWFNLGLLLAKPGPYRDAASALEALAQAARLLENPAPAHLTRADILEELGRTAEAVSALEQALARRPNDVALRLRLGRLLLETNRPGEAVRHLEAARNIDPNVGEIYPPLGRAYLAVGRAEDAARELRRAHAALPDDRDILEPLARAEVALGRYDAAVPLLERLAEGAPDDPAIRRTLANAYAEVGRTRDALEAIEIAHELEMKRREASFARGDEDLRKALEAARAENARLRSALAERAGETAVPPPPPPGLVLPGPTPEEALTQLREALAKAIEERDAARAALAQRAAAPGETALALLKDNLDRLVQEKSQLERALREARDRLAVIRSEFQDTTIELEARIVDLKNELARATAEAEGTRAEAERIEAQARFEVREAAARVNELVRLIEDASVKDLGETLPSDRPVAALLADYLARARAARDREIARVAQEEAARREAALAEAERRVEDALRAAKEEVDRARQVAEEEIRKAKAEAKAAADEEIERARQQMRAEALARRLAAIEEIRAQLEAEYLVKQSTVHGELEAQFQQERQALVRSHEREIAAIEEDYTKRLEAARAEIERLQKEVEALTSGDTSALMRSQAYRELVGENRMIRGQLEEKTQRVTELSAERAQLREELTRLRDELETMRSRMESLSRELDRTASLAPIAEALSARVNLNTASLEELRALPGIGMTEARNIVWWRENQGPFASVSDLSKVPGIEATLAEHLAPLLRVR